MKPIKVKIGMPIIAEITTYDEKLGNSSFRVGFLVIAR
jgi:hypothetical protein